MLSAMILVLLSAAPVRAAGTLFYLEPDKGFCRWMRWTERAGDEELARSEVCPAEILFDMAAKRSIFTCGAALCERVWGPEKRIIRLAALPGSEDEGLSLWLSAGSLRPRSARLVVLAPSAVTGPSDAMLFRFEGVSYKAPAAGLPEWGEPAVAVVEELDADGGWTRLGVFPTKTAAGDTPGLSVIPEDLSEDQDAATGLVSLKRTLESATCAAGDCTEPLRKTDKAAAAAVQKTLKDDEELGWFAAGKGTVFFRVVRGDTAHAQGPVSYCPKGCKTPTRLEGVPAGQLSVSPWDEHLLVTEEYSGAKPKVYKPGSPAPFFTVATGRAAVWLELPD
ncbi:MAG: hypothetical protein HYZ75_17275 [Elusimicrobia bacterium]|nr:hypothetical protein [Elusimicrobiota bacterium]